MLHRALSLLLAVSLLPAGVAFAVERKPRPRHQDRQMYAQPERAPLTDSRAFWAPRRADNPADPPASANGS